MKTLLSRKGFREAVFDRDGHKCVICGSSQDLAAHHILERKLFEDGGYYLDNGSTVCPDCHWKAESTILSCETIRKAIKANKIVPPYMDSTRTYDKWGNMLLGNMWEYGIEITCRKKGPLFDSEQCQKAILKCGYIYSETDDRFCFYAEKQKVKEMES